MGVLNSSNIVCTPPLHFSNGDSSIELRIVNYQYPDNSRDQYDADWLRIEGIVTHPSGNWRFCDPCLLTWEAFALATWLDCWAGRSSVNPTIGFIEPNLSFSRINASIGSSLRVSFELESRPPWAKKKFVGESDLWLDFPLDPSRATTAARILRDQLKRFPIRVGASTNSVR
jgi:hypothetical protein